MKITKFALTTFTATLAVGSAATAAFVGIELVEDYRGPGGIWDDNGYAMTGLTTYRVYANFDGAGDDGILAVFGQPGDPIAVQSSDGLFHNDPLGGLTAPLDLTGVGIWANQWDTYVTIGATSSAGDATAVSPGFATVTNSLGTDWSSTNSGWFVTPDDRQSSNPHIILAQFVVQEGERPQARFNILTRANETFKGLALPAPGALAAALLAAFAGRRRHRKSGGRR